jgi:hypothetical protein
MGTSWPQRHIHLAALAVTFMGLLARLWTAHGTFLNPDEALHFRLANQSTLRLAYRQSLTASHPPLLTLVLYYWRTFGTSELCLRMPLILAGVAFCWLFYLWLSRVAGALAGLIGLLFIALLPPIILLSAEIRQYPLMLAFLAGTLYFLDQAFAKRSAARMAASTLCLYLALSSHYSAFFFAAALGVYALLTIFAERPPSRLLWVWALGQIGALALAVFFYRTHIARLGLGESRTVLQGWQSEFFLRRSYYDSTHHNPALFVLGHAFGVFQFFFGQLAVGDLMGVAFLAGTAILLRREKFLQRRSSAPRLGVLLLLLFAIAAAASLAHIYPFGGTRHSAFLVIPGVAGVAVALASLSAADSSNRRGSRSLIAAGLILAAAIAFGKPRLPRMNRTDQDHAHMADAIAFLDVNVAPSEILFTDYEGDLTLTHYLCHQRPLVIDPAPAGFEQIQCAGHRVVSADYKTAWIFSAADFPQNFRELVRAYRLQPGGTLWVVQAGWDVNLPEDLRQNIPRFHDLQFQAFGNNIKLFKITVP